MIATFEQKNTIESRLDVLLRFDETSIHIRGHPYSPFISTPRYPNEEISSHQGLFHHHHPSSGAFRNVSNDNVVLSRSIVMPVLALKKEMWCLDTGDQAMSDSAEH